MLMVIIFFIILGLPIIVILGVYAIIGINIFDNSGFWYGYMSYFGTVLLSGLALWQSLKAQKLSEHMADIEIRDRKAFLTIDTERGLKVYYRNEDPLFFNLAKNAKFILPISYENILELPIEDRNDLIIIELFIKNVSDNYISEIGINKFIIEHYYYDDFDNNCLNEEKILKLNAPYCETNGILVSPHKSQNVILIIEGFNIYLNKKILNKKASDIIDSDTTFSIELSAKNLVGDETIINLQMGINEESYDEENDIKIFKPNVFEYRVLK